MLYIALSCFKPHLKRLNLSTSSWDAPWPAFIRTYKVSHVFVAQALLGDMGSLGLIWRSRMPGCTSRVPSVPQCIPLVSRLNRLLCIKWQWLTPHIIHCIICNSLPFKKSTSCTVLKFLLLLLWWCTNSSTKFNIFEFSVDLEYLGYLCLFTQSSRVWKVSKYRVFQINLQK